MGCSPLGHGRGGGSGEVPPIPASILPATVTRTMKQSRSVFPPVEKAVSDSTDVTSARRTPARAAKKTTTDV